MYQKHKIMYGLLQESACHAGDMGLSPGLGGFHMLWSN